jgi:hypothetical protein
MGGPALPVDADGEPLGTAENPLVVSGAPAGDATIVDGGDVCEGATDDAAAVAGGEGTVSAKLRTVTGQLSAIGATDDAAEDDPSQTASVLSILKGILTTENAILAILTDVYDASGHTLKTS